MAKAKSKTKGKPRPTDRPPSPIAQAAEELGVSVGWVRSQITAGTVTPARSSDKRNARYSSDESDVATLRANAAEDPTAGGAAALALVSQLEGERANLLAQVAWERAISQEQQKALEAERARTERLSAELDLQRSRVEALKALGLWDRLLGRHKAV